MYKFLLKITLSLVFLTLGMANAYASSYNSPNAKDSIIVFKFMARNETFWASYKGNEREFVRLAEFIQNNRAIIMSRTVPVLVKGYCASFDDIEKNKQFAKQRSNHVKSYIIMHHGLSENNFKTSNFITPLNGETDIVTLAFTIKAKDIPNLIKPSVPADVDVDKVDILPVVTLDKVQAEVKKPERKTHFFSPPTVAPEQPFKPATKNIETLEGNIIPNVNVIKPVSGKSTLLAPNFDQPVSSGKKIRVKKDKSKSNKKIKPSTKGGDAKKSKQNNKSEVATPFGQVAGGAVLVIPNKTKQESRVSKVKEPKPTKVKEAKPVKVKEPKPTKIKEAKPVKVKTPKQTTVGTVAVFAGEGKSKVIAKKEPKQKPIKVKEPKPTKIKEAKPIKVKEVKPVKQEKPAKVQLVKAEKPKVVKISKPEPKIAVKPQSTFEFELKTNLLYWLATVANVEGEVLYKQRIGLNLEYQFAHTDFAHGDKRIRMSAFSPELRYYPIRGRLFVGVYYNTGLYNYKFSEYGYQGAYNGGGVTVGYKLPISKSIGFEFSLSGGYAWTVLDKYHFDDGCNRYDMSNKLNYYGPTKAKVTFIWRIGGGKK